jgi:hypothetical protein
MKSPLRVVFAIIVLSLFCSSVIASNFTYERLGYIEIPGLAEMEIGDKGLFVEDALDLVIAKADKHWGISVAVGTNGMDILPFPPVDFDFDGSPDGVVRQVELSFLSDALLLKSTSLAKGIVLPWQVAAYTQGDFIQVIIGVPETFVRTYFADVPNVKRLIRRTTLIQHLRMVALVHGALRGSGYTLTREGLPGTVLDDVTINQIEQTLGLPITQGFIAPSVALPGADIEQVVEELVETFEAPSVPDLNDDGVSDAEDQAVLPTMFMRYMTDDDFSFAEMAGMLGEGFSLWEHGYSFQQWAVPRVLDLSSRIQRLFIIELCQPFYASTALSTGLHHAPSMPCAVGVWEEDGVVYANLLNPEFIFAYFFVDAGPNMPEKMAQLFLVFPTMVFNEMAGILNAGVRALGYSDQIELHPFPGM